MNTKEARDKLLALFTPDQKAHIMPLIDTLISKATDDGILRGRKEAATMIEVLVLGNGDYTHEDLRQVMQSLRGE